MSYETHLLLRKSEGPGGSGSKGRGRVLSLSGLLEKSLRGAETSYITSAIAEHKLSWLIVSLADGCYSFLWW